MEHNCYLCHENIGSHPVNIGKDTFRHLDCSPLDYDLKPSDKMRADELWDELILHAESINKSRLRLVEILAEFHKDRLYRVQGCATWDDFCKKLGVKRSWGYELLSIAKNQVLLDYVRDEPEVLETRGKQLGIIAKIASQENVDALFSLAKTKTVSELRDELSNQENSDIITRSFSWVKEDYMTIEDAIAKVKEEHGEMSSAKAILGMAMEYLG